MSIPLYPSEYKKLVEQDIRWLESNSPNSVERNHIISICRDSIKNYDEAAYQKAMLSNEA